MAKRTTNTTGHAGEFPLVQGFKSGYRNREDVTTLPPDVMVVGSQNVLTNTFQRISIRKGYTLDGQRSLSQVSATGLFTVTDYTAAQSGVDVGKTITISGISLTFGTDIVVAGVANNSELAANIVTAINASAINVSTVTGAHAEQGALPGHNPEDVIIIANLPGAAGNAITTSSTATATLTVGDTHLGGGSDSAQAFPIRSAYDWLRHTGDERHLRSGFDENGAQGKVQFRYVANAGDYHNGTTFTAGQVYWVDLFTNLTSSLFNWADFWWPTSFQSLLLGVNGTNAIYIWGGGVGTVASTSNAFGQVMTYTIPVTPADGGSGYHVNDIITLTGGGNDATFRVTDTGTTTGIITGITFSASGSGYAVNDTFTINTGNSNATGKVTSVSLGNVTGVVLLTGGSGYSTGTGKPTTAITGSGTGLTVNVTGTTVAPHSIRTVTLLTRGSGYAAATVYPTTTSGAGTGATMRVDTVADRSITLTGTKTAAELGFLLGGTFSQQLRINGNLYSYDSAVDKTFYGISADPTGEPANSVLHQEGNVQTNDTIPSLPANYRQRLITVQSNQVYLGGTDNREVYVSHADDFRNYTFSAPRLIGEGAILTLDAVPEALIPEQDAVWISAGKDFWYRVVRTLASDNVHEDMDVARVKSTSHQASRSQGLTTKIKNNIAYVSFEPIVNILGTAANYLNDPQATDLSFSIVEDMNTYTDFTNAHTFYFKKYLYFSLPSLGIVRIYNMTDDGAVDRTGVLTANHYWEAPLTMPISCFSVIDGELYGHSGATSNTYKLFSGYSDDGHPYKAVAQFAFDTHGLRNERKSSNSCYVEGYITSNTKLTLSMLRDVHGSTADFTIDGADTNIVTAVGDDASFGKSSFGKVPFGGSNLLADQFSGTNTLLPKFRVYKTYPRTPYFEEQISFSSQGVDQVWELLALGTNAAATTENPSDITE